MGGGSHMVPGNTRYTVTFRNRNEKDWRTAASTNPELRELWRYQVYRMNNSISTVAANARAVDQQTDLRFSTFSTNKKKNSEITIKKKGTIRN